jgi:hypothetical protein
MPIEPLYSTAVLPKPPSKQTSNVTASLPMTIVNNIPSPPRAPSSIPNGTYIESLSAVFNKAPPVSPAYKAETNASHLNTVTAPTFPSTLVNETSLSGEQAPSRNISLKAGAIAGIVAAGTAVLAASIGAFVGISYLKAKHSSPLVNVPSQTPEVSPSGSSNTGEPAHTTDREGSTVHDGVAMDDPHSEILMMPIHGTSHAETDSTHATPLPFEAPCADTDETLSSAIIHMEASPEAEPTQTAGQVARCDCL